MVTTLALPPDTAIKETATFTVSLNALDGNAGSIIPPSVGNAHDRILPLPGWLTKVYFIFPVILYIPDALFNYYVYSDGISTKSTNPILQAGFVVLWSFLSVGVVGMAYLLSVLAPWHWGQGHRMQAIFCGFGVVVATGITTWNSLAYRSNFFIAFQTDKWAYNIWPQLQTNGISVTMILVSIAPPFWGLFWAIVQPTQTGRSLRQLQESHEERLMRLQQEAELKRLRAQTNATIREAQVRGMAQTAAAVREQAGDLLHARRDQTSQTLPSHEEMAIPSATGAPLHTGAPAPISLTSGNVVMDGVQGSGPAPAGASQLPTASGWEQPNAAQDEGVDPDDHADDTDHGLSYPLHTASSTTAKTGKKSSGSTRGSERRALESYGVPK